LTSHWFAARWRQIPKGFHRIRHYGLLAGATKAETVATVRELPAVASPEPNNDGSSMMCLARNSFRNLLHI